MKKNKLVYVLGALLSMGVVSCDLTEKPTSFYEMDTYFTTAIFNISNITINT
jgi:starch-binding outer membrane protein, SusD/RagB family